MKLRNKKTGEIIETHLLVVQSVEDPTKRYYTGSIKDLCDNYEDYKPAEPLINDEKIRKAVRAWAELNSIYSVFVEIPNIHGNARTILSGHKGYVEWMLCVGMPELENNKTYTIAELCGEEEE